MLLVELGGKTAMSFQPPAISILFDGEDVAALFVTVEGFHYILTTKFTKYSF
jgi:hypothetical protein